MGKQTVNTLVPVNNIFEEKMLQENNTGVATTMTRSDFNAGLAESTITGQSEQMAALIARAKFVPLDELEEITTQYMKLEVGESYIVFCKGIGEKAMRSLKENPAPGEEYTDCVELMNEDGEDVINSDVVLLSTARKLAAKGNLPCFLYIFVKGIVGAKGAQYKDLQIKKY